MHERTSAHGVNSGLVHVQKPHYLKWLTNRTLKHQATLPFYENCLKWGSTNWDAYIGI